MNLAVLLAVAMMRTYTHPRCGYSFQYDAAWSVTRTDDAKHPCEVRVSPPDDDAESPSLWIDSGRGGRDAAVKATGFTVVTNEVKEWAGNPFLADGGVVAFGRKKKASFATEIRVGALEGRRANGVALECEGEDEGGKLCPRDIAFLTSGKRWVNLDSYAQSAAFELALRTLTIKPPELCLYTHPHCGFSFQYLADWAVVDEGDVCSVRIEPQDPAAGEPVRVRVGEGDDEDGRLVVGTAKAWDEGDVFQAGKLYGLRAEGASSFVFLTDRQRWAALDGDDETSDTIDIIIDSLSLDVPP